MDVDDGLGSSTSGPRRSGRARRSVARDGSSSSAKAPPSIHPFIAGPASPKPIDASRLDVDRLRSLLSQAQESVFPSFLKRLDFVNVSGVFIEDAFYTGVIELVRRGQSLLPNILLLVAARFANLERESLASVIKDFNDPAR